MSNDSSNKVRHLIRLANHHSLDAQSRETICAIAEHVRTLHKVSEKISALDTQLKSLGRGGKSPGHC